ncbi:MAG TPA: TonB-dependent receptor [Longimicrobiales bacterium]|nr:TonB-dependent receptor [Longimicrobiales bacterium]
MRNAVVTILLALAATAPLSAQARPAQAPPAAAGEVRGTIADGESRAAIGFATIEVFNGGNVLVAGAIARADGLFRVEGLPPGTYRVKVTMMGYAAHTSEPISITAAEPRATLGTIALTKSAIVLESVEVNAESQVVIAPDRNIYRAREIAPAAATATDVLESVPSVHVDADGKLSLRGNENLVVQINGRPTPIRGAQLAAYLRQLPASTLERVEVIPNPSARQDPEGMAGILNIVLKQTVDLGRSGGITLAGASTGRFAGSGNFGYQAGSVTLFTTYGYSTDQRDVTGINHRTRLGTDGAPLWFTLQDIDGRNTNSGHNISSNFEKRLNTRDALFTSLMLNFRDASDNSVSAYSELDGGRSLMDRYDRTRGTSMTNGMVDGTVGFRSLIKPQQHELSAELRFNRQDDSDRTSLWRIPDAGANRIDGELNDTDALTKQLTAQVDYMRMLGSATKLETGYKGNLRWMDRAYLVNTNATGSGDWLPSHLSNDLELDEQVHAVYGVLSRSVGRVQLQAGLRAEHAHRDFTLAGDAYPYTYRSLFPSALISTKVGENAEAKVSYSRRVRRPGTQELNPFPVFFDAQNVFFGNPELGPEYTDAIELGLQRSGRYGSLQFAPFYRRTTDIIRADINTDDEVGGREVTTISFRNVATSDSWGADLNGQFRLGTKLSGMAGFNIFKMVTDGGSESTMTSDAVTWMGRLNASYVVTPLTTIQAMYMYRAPMNVERGRFSGMSMVNLAVRQKLRGDGLTATMRVSDPFDTSGMRVEVGDANIIQLTSRGFSNRAVHLSVQATFGQAPRVRQPRAEEAPQPQTGFPPP